MTVLLGLATTLALSACGGSGGGGGGDEAEPAQTPAAAQPAATSGFITVQGPGYSVQRPEAMTEVPQAEQAEGKSLQAFKLGDDEGDQLPSDLTIGAGRYPRAFDESIRVAQDLAESRFPNYKVRSAKEVEVTGAKAFLIDSTYDSFEEQPQSVRSQQLLVRNAAGVQFNVTVRGPQSEFEQLGLDRVVPSFRLR